MKSLPSVKKVKPLKSYRLLLTFSNGEKRIFDMRPYLNKGIFKELKNVALFNTVHVSFDTVEWDNQADFDPEALYDGSKKWSPTDYSIDLSPFRLVAAEPRSSYRRRRK